MPIHDTDLELDVLATIAFAPKVQYKILQLKDEDFYGVDTKEIYNAFFKMFEESNTIDVSLIEDKKIMLKITNRQSTTISLQLEGRIRKLKEISGKRKVQRIAYDLTVMVGSGKDLSEIRDVGAEIVRVGEDNIKDITTEVVDDKLEEYMTRETDPAIKTGFPRLDSATGGFMGGTLNILASAQGVGKTTFVINLLSHICGKLNKKVLFISLEMSFMSLHAKVVSTLSGVPYSKMMYGMKNLTEDEWKSIHKARAKISKYLVYRLGEKEITTSDIRAKVKALRNVDIVIVDYLQLVKPSTRSHTMYEKITNISRELKIIASESNVPFVVVASINRDYSDRGDYRPHISDIRGSGNIEYDADMVLLLHRDSAFRDYNHTKDKDEYTFIHSADITIAKNRFGEGSLRIELYFDGEKSLIREMAK